MTKIDELNEKLTLLLDFLQENEAEDFTIDCCELFTGTYHTPGTSVIEFKLRVRVPINAIK